MLRQQLLKMNGAPECARMLGAINACIENLQRETGNAAQLDDIASALLMKLADVLSALPGAGAQQDGMAATVAAVAKDLEMLLTVAAAARAGTFVAQENTHSGH